MASTYVNDLRLNELGTGDGSGTWGNTTNTNFELIAEALSFGTEAISTNANTHTSTIADGATDPVRSMYVKYTGALDSDCTITIAPNTVSRVHFIENATTDSGSSGPYNIIISQGSGGNVTIPNGSVKMVYLDGAGSGAAVTDALIDLSLAGTTNAVTLTASGVITGSTVEATGDTAAGDNAAMGHTSAEGLILTGQGSTNDITVKNDADADVLVVPTGTTNVDIVGVTTAATFEPDGDTAAGDNAAIGYTAAEGLILTGQGSTSDVTIKNDADETVASIATGTTIFTMSDDVGVSGRSVGHVTTDNDGSFDLAVGNDFKCTTAGGLTLTFTNAAAGQSGNIMFVNGGNHTIAAHADVAISADSLTAISATGTYHLAYYCSASSGSNSILVSASAALT